MSNWSSIFVKKETKDFLRNEAWAEWLKNHPEDVHSHKRSDDFLLRMMMNYYVFGHVKGK